MPRGDEEEIAVRGEDFFRFVALLATRALLERPTLIPSLICDQLKLMASVASNRPALMWGYDLGLRTYAKLLADAPSESNRPEKIRLRTAYRTSPFLRLTDCGPRIGPRFALSLQAVISPRDRVRQLCREMTCCENSSALLRPGNVISLLNLDVVGLSRSFGYCGYLKLFDVCFAYCGG